VFFVLSFALYLGNVYQRSHASGGIQALPNLKVPATTSTAKPIAPAATQPAPAAAGATTTAKP
jgi:hypothetical protein